MSDKIEMTIPPWKDYEDPSPLTSKKHVLSSTTNNSSSFFTSFKFQKNLSRVVANSNCILIEPISTLNLRTLIPLDQVISVRSCYCKRFSKKLICDCIDEEYVKADDEGRIQVTNSARKSVSSSKRDSLEGRHISTANNISRQASSDSQSSNASSSHESSGSCPSSTNNNNNNHENNGTAVSFNGNNTKTKQSVKKQRKDNLVQAVRLSYAVPVGKFQWKVNFLPLVVPYDEHHHPEDNNSDDENSEKSCSTSSSIPSVIPPSSARALHNQVLGWVSDVSNLLEEFNRPKNLLVFINPFGGKRKAPQIYRQRVEPILRLAGINYTVILTQRANHARDLLLDVESTDLSDYHGFICVGGDGMFAELLNGIIIRRQIQERVDYDSPEVKLSRPVIPVGVIPAGSTDAVSFGVTGINDPVTSAVHVIFGKTINIDISAVHENNPSPEGNRLLRYATSVLGYGFLADVLVDSEKNRWMGPKRYDWAGFKKLLSLKAYEGEIKLRICKTEEAGSPRDSDLCQSDCTLCAKSALISKSSSVETFHSQEEEDRNTRHLHPPLHDHQLQGNNKQDNHRQEAEAVESNTPTSATANLDNDSSVITIRGKFLSVNAATMSCRCEKSKKGLSPAAHLGNGCSDLIIVSQCSRLDYIRFLLRTGYSTSQSAFDLPFVDVYRVKEFSYRPLNQDSSSLRDNNYTHNDNNNCTDEVNNCSNSNNNGVWNCDGEVIDSSAIRVKNHCQLLPVFGVGLENRFMNLTMLRTLLPRKIHGNVNGMIAQPPPPVHLHPASYPISTDTSVSETRTTHNNSPVAEKRDKEDDASSSSSTKL